LAGPDIFLSYNREDADVARRFAEGFRVPGLDGWWDQALSSGEAYDKVTEQALRGARAVVVLWTPRSVESRWVRAEATIAERNHTLVPEMIEPCELPVMFELTQTADLTNWRGDADDPAWRAFLEDVQKMVGREDAIPAQPGRAAEKLLREAEPGKSVDEYLASPRHLPIEHPRKYEAVAILRRLLEGTEVDL
jgi:hypothetical protein